MRIEEKLKVGDRVARINEDNWPNMKVGQEGIVTMVEDDKRVRVTIDGVSEFFCLAHNLKVIPITPVIPSPSVAKFKVGDLVQNVRSLVVREITHVSSEGYLLKRVPGGNESYTKFSTTEDTHRYTLYVKPPEPKTIKGYVNVYNQNNKLQLGPITYLNEGIAKSFKTLKDYVTTIEISYTEGQEEKSSESVTDGLREI